MQENFFQLLVVFFIFKTTSSNLCPQIIFMDWIFTKFYFHRTNIDLRGCTDFLAKAKDKQVLIILEQIIIMKGPYSNSSTFFSVFWNPNYLKTSRCWRLFSFLDVSLIDIE